MSFNTSFLNSRYIIKKVQSLTTFLSYASNFLFFSSLKKLLSCNAGMLLSGFCCVCVFLPLVSIFGLFPVLV